MTKLRAAALISALAFTAITSACTVTPLYGTAGSGATNLPAEMSRIWISAPKERVDQEVRNHLIFDFYGGKEAPTDPLYQFDMVVRTRETTGAAIFSSGVQAGDAPPTSSILTVSVDYTMIDVRTGEQVSTGRTSAMAPYDIQRQEFAAIRAKRDAENRAAREVARNISLMIAADLRKRG